MNLKSIIFYYKLLTYYAVPLYLINITISFYSFLGNSKITPGTAPRAIRVCSLVEVYSAADRITSIAGNATTQDLKGNLTEFEINAKAYEVEYDLDNRISKVEVDGVEIEYSYDAMGRRVLREGGRGCQGLSNTDQRWFNRQQKGDFPDEAITDNIYAIDDTGDFRRDRHAGRNISHPGEKLAPIR